MLNAQLSTEATGLKAYTKMEFFWLTVWWFIKNTGIPIAFGATVMLGFVVGLAISSQTFYSFILENLRNLGALKAMGASDRVLARMVMLQTLTVGWVMSARVLEPGTLPGVSCGAASRPHEPWPPLWQNRKGHAGARLSLREDRK